MLDLVNETPVPVSKVMERLDVSRSTVAGWFAKGLEWCKIGGKIYTTWEAIERFSTGPDNYRAQIVRRPGRMSKQEAERKANNLLASFKNPPRPAKKSNRRT